MTSEKIHRAGFPQESSSTSSESPSLRIASDQSRYIRKWFLFIALLALGLSESNDQSLAPHSIVQDLLLVLTLR